MNLYRIGAYWFGQMRSLPGAPPWWLGEGRGPRLA